MSALVSDEKKSVSSEKTVPEYQWNLVWRNIAIIFIVHILGFHGLYFLITDFHFKTALYTFIVLECSGIGGSSGAHRLWTHRAYKANLKLRILLCFFQTLGLQTPIYDWARDHRVHHKFTDTDADPHNATRGFFYSHMGWLLIRKSPEVIRAGKVIDMSDITNDRVVMFQKKYYLPWAPILSLFIPALVPWYFWDQPFYKAWCVSCMFRYLCSLHLLWCINSVTHKFGSRPYDKNILPVQNRLVSLLCAGEGWHNYHHVFPWDYKASELGNYGLNLSACFIELMAKIQWAYDLKSVSEDMVKKRIARTGQIGNKEGTEKMVWGWGDKDMGRDDMECVRISSKIS